MGDRGVDLGASMNHVHWWLFGLSFGTGLVLTLAFLARPVKRQVPQASSAIPDYPTTRIVADPPTTRIIPESPTTKMPTDIESRTTKIPVAKSTRREQVSPARESPTRKLPVPPPAPFGPGSAQPDPDGRGPAGWLVKARSEPRLYYIPDNPTYDATVPEVWFKDEDSALRAGFTPWHHNWRK
jgi:uncharacterized membrane protein ArfC